MTHAIHSATHQEALRAEAARRAEEARKRAQEAARKQQEEAQKAEPKSEKDSSEVEPPKDPSEMSLDEVQADPSALKEALASDDPAMEKKVEEAAENWAIAAAKQNLEGQEGEAGVEAAMKGFDEDMTALNAATDGQMADALQQGMEAAGQDTTVQDTVESVADADKGMLGKLQDTVSNTVTGAFGGVGGLIAKGVGLVGAGLEAGLKLQGKVNPLNVAAKGLELAGAEGAAEKVGTAGEAVEKAYGTVGEQAGNFVKGVGDGLGGSVTGVGQVIAHPLATAQGVVHLATHPGEIKAVGQQLWADASRHGTAGAVGYAAGALAPMLITGGGSGAAVAAKGASLAARGTSLASKASVPARVTGKALETTGGAMQTAGHLAGKPGALVAGSKLGQAATRPVAIGKELVGGKFGEAARHMGRSSDEIRAVGSNTATRTFGEAARLGGEMAIDGGKQVKRLLQEPKALATEALHNRQMAKGLEALHLETAKKALGGDGWRSHLDELSTLARGSDRAVDQATLAREAGEGGKYAGRVSEATLEQLEAGTMAPEAATQLARGLAAGKKLDDLETVLRGTAGFKAVDGAVKAGAHAVRTLASPDGALGLLKIDKSRFLTPDARAKYFANPQGLSPGRALILGHANKAIQYPEQQAREAERLERLNALTDPALTLSM